MKSIHVYENLFLIFPYNKIKDVYYILRMMDLLVVHLSEKAMAPHSSTLAWKISWMEEPGRLPSMGSHRVRHDWVTSLSLFTFMHWRRKWQPTPVFLPGESQGRGSLVGCRLWGHTVGHDWSDLAAAAVVHLWPIITYVLEPSILECKLEWALGSIKQS